MEGRIKWFDAERGFGFIGAEGHEDFYFPRGEFKGSKPVVGLVVEFEVGEGNRACDVRPAKDPAVYGVADFLQAMNVALTTRHPEVTVEGEVASVRSYKESILFFELKEDGAKLNCFIRKDLVPDLEEGTRVRATGAPNVTPKSAEVRLKARAIEFAGEGALKRAVEALRRRLEEEGLFAIERKRSLPAYPSALGLITAFGCDGDMDFRTKLSQRWPQATVYLASVQVQGPAAPDEIASALTFFNEGASPVEALAIVRGGGSADDLQAFNTERVVRAIVASRVPVVTGVGHENDTTLADLAADVRGMTPTDAALRIAPDHVALDQQLVETQNRLLDRMTKQMQQLSRGLLHRAAQMELAFVAPAERLRSVESGILRTMQERLSASRERLERYQEEIARQQSRQLVATGARIETMSSLVNALAPQSVLRRGFALVSDAEGVVRSVKKLRARDTVKIRFDDGAIGATIEDG